MKLISNHILFFGRAALVVIFAASSGFTAILHECMIESMECCSRAATSDTGHCDEALPVKSQTAIGSPFTCHTDKIIGGVAVTQGLVEKYTRLLHSNFTEKITAGTLSSPLRDFSGSLYLNFFQHVRQSVSPPVEKYVLYASLLI